MTSPATAADRQVPPAGLQLWIDGCGGYLLLAGNRWSIGGASGRSAVDVAVAADWPSRAGEIRREDADYFWHGAEQGCRWLPPAGALPIAGSAHLVLDRPSQLSRSAVLRLAPPHRFLGHFDRVVLVGDVILVGPSPACHIRCRQLSQRWTLTLDQNVLRIRDSGGEPAAELRPGTRSRLDGVAMALEAA